MAQSKAQKVMILSKAPPDATRVKVRDEYGKEKYRKLDEVNKTDEILLKPNGEAIWMKGTPGRKGTPRQAPIANDNVADAIRRKDAAIEEDGVLTSTKNAPESSEVLHKVMMELAEEAASLKFERSEAERKGEETSNISVRRARILQAVGETWLKRKGQLSANGLDIDSSEFQAVLGFLVETFKGAMLDSNMRPEMIETVFAKFAGKLDDNWKSEARKRIRES